MKTFLLLSSLALISTLGIAQVNDTGNKVAIGNHSPTTKLHVIDNSAGEVLRVESSTNSSQIKIRATGIEGIDWSLMSTANGSSIGGGKFSIYGNAQHRFVLDNNGFVGIGTTAPLDKLEVSGNLRLSNGHIRIFTSGGTAGFLNGLGNAKMSLGTEGGDDLVIDRNLKRIGLGTTSPLERLHVEGGALQFLNIGENQDNVDIIKIAEGATANEFTLTGMFAGTGEAGNAIKFRSSWNDDLFVIRGNGEIGLGTSAPLEKLHIEGGALQFLNIGENQDNVDIIKIAEGTTANEFTLTGMFAGTGANGNSIKFKSNWQDNLLVIQGNGNIGIGTTTPDTKLAVKGTIHTNEVKVDLNGAVAPDYVFESDYQLRSLKETEDYIKANKHLPEIPSASEMEENGVNLKEMNLKLLI